MVLLDSTVLIDYLRGRPAADRVDALFEAGETVSTTAINVEEIVRGLRPDEHVAAQALFAGLVVLPIGTEEAWLAGSWRRAASVLGRTLAQADCLIAAASVTAGARIATGNPADFALTDTDVEHWPVNR